MGIKPFMSNVFSHLYQLDESISNLVFFHFYSIFKRNLVLHCLPMSHRKDDLLIWVTNSLGV